MSRTRIFTEPIRLKLFAAFTFKYTRAWLAAGIDKQARLVKNGDSQRLHLLVLVAEVRVTVVVRKDGGLGLVFFVVRGDLVVEMIVVLIPST